MKTALIAIAVLAVNVSSSWAAEVCHIQEYGNDFQLKCTDQSLLELFTKVGKVEKITDTYYSGPMKDYHGLKSYFVFKDQLMMKKYLIEAGYVQQSCDGDLIKP